MLELVVFTSPWCGACHALMPKLEELMAKYQDVLFTKIDVQENGSEAITYGVRSLPTIIVKKENKVIFQWTGAIPIKKIEAVLNGSADRSSGI